VCYIIVVFLRHSVDEKNVPPKIKNVKKRKKRDKK